jgi:hypothetical protein
MGGVAEALAAQPTLLSSFLNWNQSAILGKVQGMGAVTAAEFAGEQLEIVFFFSPGVLQLSTNKIRPWVVVCLSIIFL